MLTDGLVQFHEDLAPLMTDIDSVQPHELNYNNGDVELITDSIVASGMYRPVFVQASTGRIIAGNHTWMACKELGATRIPVVRLDVDDTTALRLMVADNEIARKAKPDYGQLVEILKELDAGDSLIGTGMTQQDLAALDALNQIPLEESEHMSWPTLCFQVHPRVRTAFLEMTEVAGGDAERLMLLMKLAGWSG